MSKISAPYGSWKSPIDASMLTEGSVALSQVRSWRGDVYWVEDRPLEGGRSVIVRRTSSGVVADVTPEGFSTRTRVHEYGGGAYTVSGTTVFFANDEDQRLYRQDGVTPPQALTPEPEIQRGLRYADACVVPGGRHLVCVRERHVHGGEAVHEIVLLPTDGSSEPRCVVSGNDFYSSPRISPDGGKMAWMSWEHPQMPWDGTELWCGAFDASGGISQVRKVAGGSNESVLQPQWGADGELYFVSDRTGWWNLYVESQGESRPLAPSEAEFGAPHWVFGQSRYALLSQGRVACVYSRDGVEHLGVLHPGDQELQCLDLPYTFFGRGGELAGDGHDRLLFVAASPQQVPSVVALSVTQQKLDVLRCSFSLTVDPGYFSPPRAIEFPTENGKTAHALFYPPTNKEYEAPANELPPLIVMGHGGPTSQATSELRLATQFWTSRGFAVVDVNYGGSSGYGRPYRERLKGQWGVVDTQDCVNAARYLRRRGEVAGERMAIRGASAGGYTTLCALVFHDLFAAGASYYGVADAEALAESTHKFESRYLDSLIGPYPEARKLYQERSPIRYADQLSCPVILLQGEEDKVVPPAQAEVLVEALRAKRLPFAYLLLPGESHGFRSAKMIRRALEAELSFYAQLFGFHAADDIEKVTIENLP